MKLEDCKPGTRVRVYGENQDTFDAEIDFVDIDDNSMVRLKKSYYSYHPQQLRKLVKKKRPERILAFRKSYEKAEHPFEEDIPEWKKKGYEIWLMRGVKKL